MKSQVLHTVWWNISSEAAGKIWNWSHLGLAGLTWFPSRRTLEIYGRFTIAVFPAPFPDWRMRLAWVIYYNSKEGLTVADPCLRCHHSPRPVSPLLGQGVLPTIGPQSRRSPGSGKLRQNCTKNVSVHHYLSIQKPTDSSVYRIYLNSSIYPFILPTNHPFIQPTIHPPIHL